MPRILKRSKKRLQNIESVLNEVLESTKAPGFSVAVIDRNEIIYSKGFGYSDHENKIPASPNTIYAIGSCTKAFTTSILGILKNQEQLSFDDSPIKHIDGFSFFNDEMNGAITLKDLMRHSTGLPRHDLAWYLFPENNKANLVNKIKYQEPFNDVREKWYYNNFMYLLQGIIAEEITGKSWEENVAELIFEPLKMETTFSDINGLRNNNEAAIGYELIDGHTSKKMDYYDLRGISPAGSINSTVLDMANWLKAWINGGQFDGIQVLPSTFVNEAISSQMIISGGLPSKEHADLHFSNYGFGWFLSSYKGHYMVQHGGNIDGFTANTAFFPSDSIGIVVLTNQNGSAVPSLVRNIIADKVLNLPGSDWNGEFKKNKKEAKEIQKNAKSNQSADKVEGTKPSHPLESYIGQYKHPGYGQFELSVENDSLFATFPKTKLWLKHFHYDIFEPFEVDETGIDSTGFEIRMGFITGNDGEIKTLEAKFEPAIDPIKFERIPIRFDVNQDDLKNYEGNYEFSGMTLKSI